MMNSEVGFGRKVLQVFEDQGISFEHVPSGIDTMTVYVHQDEFEEKEQQVIAGIHRAVQPDFVEMESDLALIAVALGLIRKATLATLPLAAASSLIISSSGTDSTLKQKIS